MLPIVVLRRLDCVLEPTKDAVLKENLLTEQSSQLGKEMDAPNGIDLPR